jgi:hypothetical protein
MTKMKKLFKNKRLGAIMLFVAMMILSITTTLTIGPPDEAPPLLDGG